MEARKEEKPAEPVQSSWADVEDSEEEEQENSPSSAPPSTAAPTSKLGPSDKSKFHPTKQPKTLEEPYDYSEETEGSRGHQRGHRRARRHGRGGLSRYVAKPVSKQNLRDLVPAGPNDLKNTDPSISKEMIKIKEPPYVIHFINCPEDIAKDKLAGLFEIKQEDVKEIADIKKTNGIPHTCVTIKDKDPALKMFEKYTKDNVRLRPCESK